MMKACGAAVCLAVLGCLQGQVWAQSEFEQRTAELTSSSPTVRVAAVEYFRNARTTAANNVLLERLGAEKDLAMKIRLVEALDVSGSTAAFAAVAELAGDPNRQVAHSAVIVLGRSGRTEAVIPVFEKILAAPGSSAKVKQAVVNALGLHPGPEAVRLLDSVAADTANPSGMRQTAVSYMRRFGTKDAADKVKLYINDKDAAVKSEAKKKKTDK